MANADMCMEAARNAFPYNEELRVAYMIGFNEGFDRAMEQPEVELENYISGKLRKLGADLINHKPYSFNRGLNVGKTNAYKDILDRLNARKDEEYV